MNTRGIITVTIVAIVIVISIALADFFMAKLLGIDVEQVPLIAVTFVRMLMLAAVVYGLYKFFGSSR